MSSSRSAVTNSFSCISGLLTIFRAGISVFLIFIAAMGISFGALSQDKPTPQEDLENIRIQLKWKHQFQFAGYYAAIEQGYFAQEGLRVELLENNTALSPVEQVVSGRADYGISDSSLVLARVNDKPVVLLAQFFQRSPLVLLSLKSHNINRPSDLVNKTVVYSSADDNTAIKAILASSIGSSDQIKRLDPGTEAIQQLIEGKIEAYLAYSSNEPFTLQKQGVEFNALDPQDYAIDFYGDNLFTIENELVNHPGRAERVLRATQKGWKYALENPKEVIELIRDKYAPNKSQEHLEYEANVIQQMISPNLFALGDISWQRLNKILKTMSDVSDIDSPVLPSNFVYESNFAAADYLGLTQAELDVVSTTNKFTLTSGPFSMPYFGLNKDGSTIGVFAEFAELMSQSLGNEVTYQQATSWQAATNSPAHIGIQTEVVKKSSKDIENNKLLFSSPLVIAMASTHDSVSGISNIADKKIGIVDGLTLSDEFLQAYGSLELISFATPSEAFERIANNELDALLCDLKTCRYQIHDSQTKQVRIVGRTNYNVNYNVYTSSEPAELESIFTKVLPSISKAERDYALRQWWVPSTRREFLQSLTTAENQWLEDSDFVISMAADPDWMPYERFNENGEFIGIVADYIKLMEQRSGIKINIVQTKDWQETVDLLTNNEIDMISAGIQPVIGRQYSTVSDHYLQSPVVIVMENNAPYVDGLHALANKNVAVIDTFGYIDEINDSYPNVNIVPVPNIESGLLDVSTGKYDAMLCTLSSCGYRIAEMSLNSVRIVGSTEYKTYIAFLTPKEKSTIVPILNKALATVSEEEKREILARWNTNTSVERIDYSLLWQVALFFIFVVVVLWLWTRQLQGEIRKRIEVEGKLKKLNQRFEQAAELVSLGVWEMEIAANKSDSVITFDQNMRKLYGFSEKDNITWELCKTRFLQEDIKKIESHVFSINAVSKPTAQLNFRIVDLNGNIKHIFSSLRADASAQKDTKAKLIGVHWDITSLKHTEEQLRLNHQRIHLAIDAVSMGFWELTTNLEEGKDPTMTFDQTTASIYGFKLLNEVNYRTWLERVHPEDRKMVTYDVFEKLESGVDKTVIKFRFRPLTGEWRYMYAGVSVDHNYENPRERRLVGVNWDMTETKRSEEKLRLATLQAESSNKAKSEFLANMSHEIRTPLNSIIGFTELLEEHVKEKHLRGFVTTIQSAGNSLLSLINDILDLSKIEAGKLRIVNTPCDPHYFLEDISNIFIMRVREKNLDYFLEIDPRIPTGLNFDDKRVRQILFNLIGNAVKFTHSGHIKVRAYSENEDEIRSKLDLVIEVEDTGIGISEDQTSKIFGKFEQSSGQDFNQYGGTGLGLSISSRLAELMGGEITVTSEVGKGSCFTFRLRSIDVASVRSETHIDKSDAEKIANYVFKSANILVVDDIEDNRFLVMSNFADTGITIATAENGEEAVDMARAHNFDLILMDIRMPVMDGYEAAKRIKAFSDVPIVALTASVMLDEYEKNKSEAFDGYLRKPVLRKDLLEEVARYIKYDIVKKDEKQAPEPLSKEQGASFKIVQAELEKLEIHVYELLSTNSISDIKAWNNKVKAIVKSTDIDSLQDFTHELEDDLESFNIIGIRAALNGYADLLNSLAEQSDTD